MTMVNADENLACYVLQTLKFLSAMENQLRATKLEGKLEATNNCCTDKCIAIASALYDMTANEQGNHSISK